MSPYHPEVSIGTGVEPERNVRQWFRSLASGDDRSMVIAILDEAFNETVISLAFLGIGRSNQTRKPNYDLSGVARSVALDDLILKYRQLEQNYVDPFLASTSLPEDTTLRIEELSGKSNQSTQLHNISRENCTFTESRLDKRTGETNKAVPTNKSSLTDDKSDYKFTTFKSGLALPIGPEKHSLRQSNEILSSSKSLVNNKVKVDDKLNFNLLTSTQTTIESSYEKRKKSHALVAESKQAASSAISSISRRILTDEEHLAEQFCIVYSPALNHLEDRVPTNTGLDEPIRISILTINPNFLDIQDENVNRFLQLVDKVIRSTLDQRHGPEKNDVIHFLSEDLSSNGNTSFGMPRWLELCMDPDLTSIKLLLVIFARMEISVREAHRRYLVSYRQEQNPEKNRPVLCISDMVSTTERMTDSNIISCNNTVECMRQLLNTSTTLVTFIHKMETLKTVLRLWRGVQTKKTYSTILLDTNPSQNYGTLHPGLSPFRLQDVLLVPFCLVSEFAIVYGKVKEQRFSQNFLSALAIQWKMIYVDGWGNFSLSEKSSTQNLVVNNPEELATECPEAFYDVYKNTEDDSSQLHDDSKSKKKKKKKKKKKSSNHMVNEKCSIDHYDDGYCDNSKSSAHDIPENSTNDHVDPCSKSFHQDTMSPSAIQNSIGTKTDITVSKLSGSHSTCVVGTGRVETEDDGDVWETVEHKSARVNGKNKKDSSAIPIVSPANIMSHDFPPATSIVSSPSGRSKSGRGKKRNSRRQSIKQNAKEIITTLIQSAEEEILLRKEIIETSTFIDRKSSAWVSDQCADTSACVDKVGAASSLDLSSSSNNRKMTPASNLSATTFAEVARLSLRNNDNYVVPIQGKDHTAVQGVNGAVPGRDSDKLKLQKCTASSSADHNTAQTCPETISGISGASNSSLTPIVTCQKTFDEGYITSSGILSVVQQNDSPTTYETQRNESFESSDEEEPNFSAHSDTSREAPPLQTLLGPGLTNSATSSVASSLEVPHAIRRSRYSNATSCKEDDVGYHLLKVCEKLSEEMNTFMIRRASALTQRRRERAALLAALQDIAQNIWTNYSCHVEMYGSCATQLDLPSSDLDVVVCGLDCEIDRTVTTRNGHKFHKLRQSRLALPEEETTSSSTKEIFSKQHPQAVPQSVPEFSYHQFYPSLSSSGMRVLRLAADLERQPWAVQVKAIPTASVPVVKVLADPSRLSGAISGNGEWLLYQQSITAASAVAAGGMIPMHQQHYENLNFATGESGLSPTRYSSNVMPTKYQKTQPPWRGADVMNGLISVDITFEGPEHGGIGSTTFSARVVQEACTETGLPPDRTPAVQLIMVLKEMLAQRRLNEPFSGGLSSYAILLLAVAVIKERRAIREELERVERQRKAVAMESSSERELSPKSDHRYHFRKQKAKKESKSEIMPKEIHDLLTNLQIEAKQSMENSKGIGKIEEQNPPEPKENENASKMETETIRSPLFPQGSNDVLEVLCSGEPTAGKLLMHFLLYYGHHFDAQSTCIDVLGTHHPDYVRAQGSHDDNGPTFLRRCHLSPFLQRKTGGVYDTVMGIYTVDHIVVYDPLEGAESNNVARSCFAWSTIRWVFEQCYNTLIGLVERDNNSVNGKLRSDKIFIPNISDPDDMPHLLELLLSF